MNSALIQLVDKRKQAIDTGAVRLAEDARYADEEVRQTNSQQMLGEWSDVMRLVGQIQSLVR